MHVFSLNFEGLAIANNAVDIKFLDTFSQLSCLYTQAVGLGMFFASLLNKEKSYREDSI